VRFRAWRSLHNKAIDGPLEALLGEWKPDVVHAHLVHTHIGYHALTQAARSGAAVVFTAHDVMTFCYQKLTCFHGGEEHGGTQNDVVARLGKCVPCQRLRFRPGRNARIREVMQRDVHRLTVVSDALGEVLRANDLRVDRTVHNALALNGAVNPEVKSTFQTRYDLNGKLVMGLGGRLHKQKGVGKLLEMLKVLQPRFGNLRLLLMGKRDVYDREFKQRAHDLGVQRMVVGTGWLEGDELAAAYSSCDVFVTPSLCFDTFGLVNLEAMQHGVPVVATSMGGSHEVVLDGETGFIANPFDVSAYADRIATLLADPDLRQSMGRAGRERLESHFGIERLHAEFLEEYESAREAQRIGSPR
jgi:glycosyltransferase involved in cell wall biosynthesis